MSEIRWQKGARCLPRTARGDPHRRRCPQCRDVSIDESDEKTAHVWHVHQIFATRSDHDFGIMGDVDLDATQDGGEVIFKNYRVGFIEDLLED